MSMFEKESKFIADLSDIDVDKISDKVCKEKFGQLMLEYSKLLKQIKMLTKHNDKQSAKLRRIEHRLKKYVSQQLYKNIVKGRELAENYQTVRKNITVFFSDIKSFSTITSEMDGETLSEFLNSYLEEMTIIVNKYGGTLDKYIGDAIMVFFGAPGNSSIEDNVKNCLQMSYEMREKMKTIRKKWFLMGYEQPFHIRIGIATGWCMVGNFGSSERMDYTISGKTVNLASRLEQSAEVDEIQICHTTWGIAQEYINCNPPDEKILKGFNHPKITHQLITFKSEKEDIENAYRIEGDKLIIDKSKATKENILRLLEKVY